MSFLARLLKSNHFLRYFKFYFFVFCILFAVLVLYASENKASAFFQAVFVPSLLVGIWKFTGTEYAKTKIVFIPFIFALAVTVPIWNLLVYIPIYDFRNNVSYRDVLNFIEDQYGVAYNSQAPILVLPSGETLDDGLQSCGEVCVTNFTEKNLKQEFYIIIKNVVEGQLFESNKEFYKHYFVIEDGKLRIKSIKIARDDQQHYSKRPLIVSNGSCRSRDTDLPQFKFRDIYKKMGIHFCILVSKIENNFVYASIIMRKNGSWLRGYGKPLSQGSSINYDLIDAFHWFDVLKHGKDIKVGDLVRE